MVLLVNSQVYFSWAVFHVKLYFSSYGQCCWNSDHTHSINFRPRDVIDSQVYFSWTVFHVKLYFSSYGQCCWNSGPGFMKGLYLC